MRPSPGPLIAGDAALSVEPGAALYVSRGGLKLAAALDGFGLDPAGRIALDIGASTGGFTEVTLFLLLKSNLENNCDAFTI